MYICVCNYINIIIYVYTHIYIHRSIKLLKNLNSKVPGQILSIKYQGKGKC